MREQKKSDLKQKLRRQFSSLVLCSLILIQVSSVAFVYLIEQDDLQMQRIENCMILETDSLQEAALAENDKLFSLCGSTMHLTTQNEDAFICISKLDNNTHIEINTPPPEHFV